MIPVQQEPLSWLAAERLAATQGARLARLARSARLDPADFIASLPVVRVEFDAELPDARTSYWDEQTSHWVIVVRATDNPIKRRCSIIHEFKRILDRGHEAQLYDARYLQGHSQSEMAADYFVSCALMPSRQVRHVVEEHRTIASFARHFHVSQERAARRLSDLNLLGHIKPAPEGRTS